MSKPVHHKIADGRAILRQREREMAEAKNIGKDIGEILAKAKETAKIAGEYRDRVQKAGLRAATTDALEAWAIA